MGGAGWGERREERARWMYCKSGGNTVKENERAEEGAKGVKE